MWRLILIFVPCFIKGQDTSNDELWLEQWIESDQDALPEQIDGDDLPLSTIPLNSITRDQLAKIGFLSKPQIESFLQYRTQFGPFLVVEELRAVPLFDWTTIQKMKSKLVVDQAINLDSKTWDTDLSNSNKKVSLRMGRTYPKKLGYLNDKGYLGSPFQLTGKFTLDVPSRLKLGVAIDKDSGEPLPFHLNKHLAFYQPFSSIEKILLGDFRFQMGQGLIGGQSFGSGLSLSPGLLIKGLPDINPKRGSTEGNYQSGLGVKWSSKKHIAMIFLSYRNRNGNLKTDSILGDYLTSVNIAGLNRTESELANKNTIKHLTAGGNWTFNFKYGFIGVNSVFHHYTKDIIPVIRPYNQFTFSGNQLLNLSANFQFNIKGHLWFAESALDHHLNQAHLIGWLLTPSKNLDIVLSYRNYSPKYQAIETRTFGRFGRAQNEKGVFFLIKYQPHLNWELSFYNDIRAFPWLRYNVHAPSVGNSLRFRIQFVKKKTVQFYADIRSENATINEVQQIKLRSLTFQNKTNFRFHLALFPAPTLEWRVRVENSYLKESNQMQKGQLFLQDLIYKPKNRPFDLKFRITLFDIPNYNLRIYQYEHQMSGFFGMPAFYGRGISWYFLPRWKTKNCLIEARVSRMYQPDVQTIGSQWETIEGKYRTDLGLQVIYNW